MMMTGMVTDRNKLLVRGELDLETNQYPGYQCLRLPEETTSTLIHRLAHCAKTQPQTSLPKGRQALDKVRAIFMEKDKSLSKMEVLKMLTKIAI